MTKKDLMNNTAGGTVVPLRSDQAKRLTNNAQARLLSLAIRNLIAKHHSDADVTAVLSACLHIGVWRALETDFGPKLPQYLRGVADSVEKHLAKEKKADATTKTPPSEHHEHEPERARRGSKGLPGGSEGAEDQGGSRPKNVGSNGGGQGEVES